MTYDTYRNIFYGGAALALLFLIISIILFIALKIPSVIGVLSGATAKKAIENIRKQNEQGSVHSVETNINRGKQNANRNGDINAGAVPLNKEYEDAFVTTKIGTEQLSTEAKRSYETSLLDKNEGTETTVLSSDEYGGTTVLQPETITTFAVEYELILIHTNEMIG